MTKIKKVSTTKYIPMVKVGWFKWKGLSWTFYNEQPKVGFTEMKAVISELPLSRDYVSCIELIENFKKYKGAGVTIW